MHLTNQRKTKENMILFNLKLVEFKTCHNTNKLKKCLHDYNNASSAANLHILDELYIAKFR